MRPKQFGLREEKMHWFWSIWPENLFGLRGVYSISENIFIIIIILSKTIFGRNWYLGITMMWSSHGDSTEFAPRWSECEDFCSRSNQGRTICADISSLVIVVSHHFLPAASVTNHFRWRSLSSLHKLALYSSRAISRQFTSYHQTVYGLSVWWLPSDAGDHG